MGEDDDFFFYFFQSSSMKRPVIPSEFGAKVPTNIRQRYLNTFIDECVKFCPSEEAAFQMVNIIHFCCSDLTEIMGLNICLTKTSQ